MLLDKDSPLVKKELWVKKLRTILNSWSEWFFSHIEDFTRKVQEVLSEQEWFPKNTNFETSPELRTIVKQKFLSDVFWLVSRKLRNKNFYDKESLLLYTKNLFEKYLNWRNISDWKKVNISIFYSWIWKKWFANYLEKDEQWRKRHIKSDDFYSKLWFSEDDSKKEINLCEFTDFQLLNKDSWIVCIDSILDWWNYIIHFDWFDSFQEEIIKDLINRVIDVIKEKINEIQYKYTSSVTWCKNRNYFSENAENRNYSVIAIDLDDFKKINDTKWHIFWDKVLKRFWKLLKSCIRENEWEVIHLSWDEFCIFVKDNGEEKYNDILSKVLEKIEELKEKWDFSIYFEDKDKNIKENLKIKFSLWVCDNDWDSWKLSVEECYKVADERMLELKTSWKSEEAYVYRIYSNLKKFSKEKQIRLIRLLARQLWFSIKVEDPNSNSFFYQ